MRMPWMPDRLTCLPRFSKRYLKLLLLYFWILTCLKTSITKLTKGNSQLASIHGSYTSQPNISQTASIQKDFCRRCFGYYTVDFFRAYTTDTGQRMNTPVSDNIKPLVDVFRHGGAVRGVASRSLGWQCLGLGSAVLSAFIIGMCISFSIRRTLYCYTAEHQQLMSFCESYWLESELVAIATLFLKLTFGPISLEGTQRVCH